MLKEAFQNRVEICRNEGEEDVRTCATIVASGWETADPDSPLENKCLYLLHFIPHSTQASTSPIAKKCMVRGCVISPTSSFKFNNPFLPLKNALNYFTHPLHLYKLARSKYPPNHILGILEI